MICPDCGGIYPDGTDECCECGGVLVVVDDSERDFDDYISVFATDDPVAMGVAESLLEEADISYFAKGDELQDAFGPGHVGLGFSPVAGPMEIQVSEEDTEEALTILEDLENRYDDDFMELDE